MPHIPDPALPVLELSVGHLAFDQRAFGGASLRKSCQSDVGPRGRAADSGQRTTANYFCWALIADALHADRCLRRDSAGIFEPHVPFCFATRLALSNPAASRNSILTVQKTSSGTWSSRTEPLSRRLQRLALSASSGQRPAVADSVRCPLCAVSRRRSPHVQAI